MKPLALKDKKLLAVTGICVLLALVFWMFIYLPSVRKVASLKKEIDAVKKEISEIELRGGEKGRDIKQMVDSIRRDFNIALQKLPSEEEEVLKFISSEANKDKLDISNIAPRPKKPMVDANGAPVMLEGRQCIEMPVSIEMKGIYKSVKEYIKALRAEDNPFLIRIEDISMRKDPAIAPRLRTKLELVIYLSS